MNERRALRAALAAGQGSPEALHRLAALEGVSLAALERELAETCSSC